MGTPENQDKEAAQGAAAAGYSAAYDARKEQAAKELAATMAGNAHTAPPADDTGVKNPDGEAQAPAPSRASYTDLQQKQPGPNGPGNSAGDGTVDPQGQQGSTLHGRSR